MEGLVPGRIVYYVFTQAAAAEVNRRRTTSKSIADRMQLGIAVGTTVSDIPPRDETIFAWPAGAQAHIGNEVKGGDIYPAMVLRIWGQESGCANLRVFLDGNDDYWATSVNYYADKREASWHWMFDGQATRYTPDNTVKAQTEIPKAKQLSDTSNAKQ